MYLYNTKQKMQRQGAANRYLSPVTIGKIMDLPVKSADINEQTKAMLSPLSAADQMIRSGCEKDLSDFNIRRHSEAMRSLK